MAAKNLRDGTITVRLDDDGAASPVAVEVELEDGDLRWSERRPVNIILDRAALSHARRAADELVDISFSAMLDSLQAPDSGDPTLYEVLTRTGAAAAYVSKQFGEAADGYLVDLEFAMADPAGNIGEVLHFNYFSPSDVEIQEGDPYSVLRVSGVCPLYWVDTVELVTNGAFGADTDWTKGTNWQISGGVASQSSPAASDIEQAITMSAGGLYRLTYTVANRSAGAIVGKLRGTSGTSRSTNGTFTEIIQAGDTNGLLEFTADGTWDGDIDDVSLLKVSHAGTG